MEQIQEFKASQESTGEPQANDLKLKNQQEPSQEQEILNSLNGFYGSENFYKDFLGCVLTDGFKFFCEKCSCYWLFTDIASVLICNSKFKQEGFILGKIKVNKDKSAIVELYRDYDENNKKFNAENLLYTQKYKYTDFPLKEYSFYICLNELNTFTFMLKSEY